MLCITEMYSNVMYIVHLAFFAPFVLMIDIRAIAHTSVQVEIMPVK